jgi:hypothetical protein
LAIDSLVVRERRKGDGDLRYAIKSVQEEKFQDAEPFVDSTVVLVNSESLCGGDFGEKPSAVVKAQKSPRRTVAGFSIGAASVAWDGCRCEPYGVGWGATTP